MHTAIGLDYNAQIAVHAKNKATFKDDAVANAVTEPQLTSSHHSSKSSTL